MIKYFYSLMLVLLCLTATTTINAQKVSTINDLPPKGNKAFIEVIDKNQNTGGLTESFKKHLLGIEWNRWELVENKEDADFICRLNVEKKGFSPVSVSYGARVRTVVEILTTEGKSLWKSKRQQGNTTIYTAGDALSDAMRKVIRRSLKEELYQEKD